MSGTKNEKEDSLHYDLLAVLARLRNNTNSRTDIDAFKRMLSVLAAKITSNPTLQEGAVEAVYSKLIEQILDDDLDEITVPVSWFSVALRWRIRDIVREQKRRLEAQTRAGTTGGAETVTEPTSPLEDTQLLRWFDQLAERAVQRRDEWQRDHLRRSLAQIRRLQTEDITLRQIILDEGEIDPADAEERRLAEQRAHKAHTRARGDLDRALPSFAKVEGLEPEDVAKLQAMIEQLKRRKTPAKPERDNGS